MKLILDLCESLELFIVDCCMCLFILQIPCNWMATDLYFLVAIQAVYKQLHSFCNNSGFGILVSLTTSFVNRLHKVVQFFHRSVFNETMIFWANVSQLQKILVRGIGATMFGSKTEVNNRHFSDNNPYFSADSCTTGSISCLLTFVFLDFGEKFFFQVFWNFNVKLYVSKQCAWFHFSP